MFALIQNLLNGFLSVSAKRVLLGSGLTMVNAAGTFVLLRFLISQMHSSFDVANADLLNFIGLCGLDTYLSIVTGAIVAAATIDKGKIKFAKVD